MEVSQIQPATDESDMEVHYTDKSSSISIDRNNCDFTMERCQWHGRRNAEVCIEHKGDGDVILTDSNQDSTVTAHGNRQWT